MFTSISYEMYRQMVEGLNETFSILIRFFFSSFRKVPNVQCVEVICANRNGIPIECSFSFIDDVIFRFS